MTRESSPMASSPERGSLFGQKALLPKFCQSSRPWLNNRSRRFILVGTFFLVVLFFVPVAYRLQWSDSAGFNPKNDALDLDKDVTDEKARVGKIAILYGDENPVYERALRTHKLHNRMHGYPIFIQRENILDGYWTKPAHILSVLLRELSKPASQRLLWLWWFDADTIILNYLTPLEAFLPPTSASAAGSKEAAEELKKVSLLTTDDWNGLNNGIFALRVSPYAVELLSGVLAYRDLRANESLTFQDQSAMENMMKMRKYARYAVKVPQRWFNAYPDEEATKLESHHVRPGDLLVHFPGVSDRETAMSGWLSRSERRSSVWNVPPSMAGYPAEVSRFWTQYAADRRRMRESWTDARDKLREFNETAQSSLVAAEGGGAPEEAIKAFSDARFQAERILNETAERSAEDVIPGDVEDMNVVLTQFERASTRLLGYVGESPVTPPTKIEELKEDDDQGSEHG